MKPAAFKCCYAEKDYNKALILFSNLRLGFEKAGNTRLARAAEYYYRVWERRRLYHLWRDRATSGLIPWVGRLFLGALTGYGERPAYLGIWIAMLILTRIIGSKALGTKNFKAEVPISSESISCRSHHRGEPVPVNKTHDAQIIMKDISESVVASQEMLSELFQSWSNIEAALLYGSVARGEAERHSDTDILALCAVGQKRSVYDGLTTALSGRLERVSLSIYSKRELAFLAKARSLFLLHLSRESVSIIDRTGWITELIRNFEPKQSYDNDFRKSLELVSPLQTVVANAPNQFHRLAYTYSLFRVFGVYLLAARHVFEFSKTRMTQRLMTAYPRESQHIKSLAELRVMNANFFAGGRPSFDAFCSPAGLDWLYSSINSLGGLLGMSLEIKDLPYSEAVDEFLDAAMSNPFRLGYRLRTWFLLLVYDGINLFLATKHYRTLTSFSQSPLTVLASSNDVPEPVRHAASLGVEYLRNYPLKYFLLEESKIATRDACSSLFDLAQVIRAA